MSQHMTALARANEVRFAHAAAKRALKAGEVTIADLFASEDEMVDRMKVAPLLAAQRQWGKIRAHKLLTRLGISEFRRVGEITPRQRQRIVEAIRASSPRPGKPDEFSEYDDRILAA